MSGFPAGASALTHLLVVSDFERSVAWYRDVLGARLEGSYGGTSAVFEIIGCWLLVVTGGEPTADKPTVSFVAPENPDRASSELIFRVDDCLTSYEQLLARGAEFLTPPVDHGYEVRAFFRDPDGHLFEISSLPGGGTATDLR
ncbi:MAG: VOC family protein [Deltaproteobacteria bacterium]|nr:VOC family protein [Deltaproteobacteria bacterium]